MGLLDSDALKNLFGTVFSGLYGTGRLIRVTKVRGNGGVMLNRYEQPVPIKVQVDRCDEEMRRQSGFTSDNVKLLVLQAGVSSPAPTTDDVIEAKGARWNMFAVGEDPASTYWRGRGVKQSPTSRDGWFLEFGHWDDAGVWRDDVPWNNVPGPHVANPIENWTPQEEAQSTILALIEAGGGDILGMTWQKAAEQLEPIVGTLFRPGDNAGVIRLLLNERV